jgi:hypothetical protein
MVKIDGLHRQIVSDLDLIREPGYHPAFAGGERGILCACKEAWLVMRSSAAVAGRALIMLACVVALPTVALWGTSWSDVVKRIQDFRLPECIDLTWLSGSVSSDDPSRGPTVNAGTAATGPSAPAPLALAGEPGRGNPPLTPVPSPATAAAPSAVVPTEYQAPAELSPVAAPLSDDGGRQTTGDAKAADQFQVVQERLRQLGATYYLLESWGNQQQLYRFYCKMAVGGSAQYTRCFEATDADSLQSMVEVLRQVETWRGGGLAKAESSE